MCPCRSSEKFEELWQSLICQRQRGTQKRKGHSLLALTGAGGLFGWDRVPLCPEIKTSECLPLFGEMIVHRVVETLMEQRHLPLPAKH